MVGRTAFLRHKRIEQQMALIRLAGNYEPRHGLKVLLGLLLCETIGSGPLQPERVVGAAVAHHASGVALAFGYENRLDARFERPVVELLRHGRSANAWRSNDSRSQDYSSPVHLLPSLYETTSLKMAASLAAGSSPQQRGSISWGRGPRGGSGVAIPSPSHPRRGWPRTGTSS